jgi:hypothetical protein
MSFKAEVRSRVAAAGAVARAFALRHWRVILLVLVVVLIAGAAFGATTVTVTTPPTFDLYQGTSKVSPAVTRPSFAECMEAGRLLNKGDGCQSRNGKFKRATVADPPAIGGYEAGPSTVSLTGRFLRFPGSNLLTGSEYGNDPRTVNGATTGIFTRTSWTLNLTGAAKLYVGGWNSWGQLTVTQNGATVYTHATPVSAAQWNGVYTLNLTGTYTVRWENLNPAGNVTIQAIVGSAAPATGTASLSWVAPTHNTDGTPATDLAGYRVYHGTDVIPVTGTSYQFTGLASGGHDFAVTAINSAGAESDGATGSKVIP